MALEPQTIEPLVSAWAQATTPPWSAAEKERATRAMAGLGATLVPFLVADVPMAPERAQQYYLWRVVRRLEDWLCGTAASLRAAFGATAIRLRPGSAAPALGIRSSTVAELEALPAIGRDLAEKVARHGAVHGDAEDMKQLLEIDGLGPQRLHALDQHAYMEQARGHLVSPSLLALMEDPRVETLLAVLARTDLSLVYGDYTTLKRRPPASAGSPGERFVAFLEAVLEHARRASRPVDGVLASEAEQELARHDKYASLVARASPVTGGVLVNEAYVQAVRGALDGAARSVDLMVFLGTATAGSPEHPGSLTLIERLEAAAARGVRARVILDQDDRGVPYRSAFINRPLYQRLKSKGIAVKLDEKDTLLHSKLLVVDAATVIVGSHNWTTTALTQTHEVSVLLEGAQAAKAFADRFEAIWSRLPAST